MIVGIMADTHDHLDNTNRALELFCKKGVGHIIHAGDFTSPFTQRAFKYYGGGLTAVFGNNDGDRLALSRVFQNRIFQQPHIFTLNERKIAVVHEPDTVKALADSGLFDLVVYGHTHEAVISRTGKTLVVNPGEVCGWVYGKPSVVILDMRSMEAAIALIS